MDGRSLHDRNLFFLNSLKQLGLTSCYTLVFISSWDDWTSNEGNFGGFQFAPLLSSSSSGVLSVHVPQLSALLGTQNPSSSSLVPISLFGGSIPRKKKERSRVIQAFDPSLQVHAIQDESDEDRIRVPLSFPHGQFPLFRFLKLQQQQ